MHGQSGSVAAADAVAPPGASKPQPSATASMIRALAALAALLAPCRAHAAPAAPPIAVFDFEIVNTSPAPTTDVEADRARRLGDALRQALDASGRYHAVAMDAVRESVRGALPPRACNGCELPAARRLGAAFVAYGWIQKVSNLILNLNLVIECADSGRHVAVGSVDIRGNTDESWFRGLRYLLRERILPEQP